MSEMSSNKKMRLYFITYNVATKYPDENPNKMLNIENNKVESLPDFYIIGLQEVKSQPQNMVLDMLFEDPWTKSFKDALKGYDYIKIRTQRLQGLVLNVFCARKHLKNLRLIEAKYTRTGLGGMWGNKGAISVRLSIYGVNICIINTHLTPHDHLLVDRISDYNTILREHSFQVPETRHILYHDYIFWIGDLNFRLQGDDLDANTIDSLIKNNQLDLLLARDQLKLVMNNGEAFAELIEKTITFPPTYKFEFTSQNYDLKRRPSWTDRILYKVNTNVYEDTKLQINQLNYNSHPSYVTSDHRPVTAEFDIIIRPDIADYSVEFEPVSQWFIDEENSIIYKIKGNYKSVDGDWVGLFPDRFLSLDDYLVYEYVCRGKITGGESTATKDKIFFSESALRSPGMYRLIYVAQCGDVVSILGISSSFPGLRRPLNNIQ